MNCFPESTYSIYADGELDARRSREVEEHLATCARCRSLVEGLKRENLLIFTALSLAEEEPATLPPLGLTPPSRTLAVALFMMLAAGLGFGLALQAVGELVEVPSALEWLNPLNTTAQVNAFFSTLFYLLDEGASMVLLAFTTVGVLIVILMVLFGSLLLRGSRRVPHGAALGLLLISLCAPRSFAAEVRHSNGGITVPAGQTVNDTLIAGGESVTVDGNVTGNLIATGRRITVRGSVGGDVFAAGQTVEVEGSVAGNVVISGQWLSVRGRVSNSVLAAGQQFRLESQGEVQGDVIAFTGETRLEGKINRDVTAFTGVTEVRSSVGRHLTAYTSRLILPSMARVGGNLTAHADNRNAVAVEPGVVAGKTEIEIGRRGRPYSRFSEPRFYKFQILQFLAAMLAGGVLILLFPAFLQATSQAAGVWGRSMGLGFAALFAVPVAAILACISLIGIPLGLTAIFLWICAIYLAKVFVAIFVGQALLQRSLATRAETLLALAIGLAIIFVVVQIPYAGAWIHSVVFCLGLGAFSYQLSRSVRPA